ncbi:uncharacterized protein An14g02680 [Aspergillus niger]|uniref:Contig An14c0110, genomic contig n=2 Tax=Aspergillus niger TaxID=5061 RepID=A2R314_ASPNC|nr:uncharacterized protein An14g02680 [Aspergillus niger]CAK46516.1 unnamed protein product [Aspergillus niger]
MGIYSYPDSTRRKPGDAWIQKDIAEDVIISPGATIPWSRIGMGRRVIDSGGCIDAVFSCLIVLIPLPIFSALQVAHIGSIPRSPAYSEPVVTAMPTRVISGKQAVQGPHLTRFAKGSLPWRVIQRCRYVSLKGTPYTAVLARSRLRRGPWPAKALPNKARQPNLLTNTLQLYYHPKQDDGPLMDVIGEYRGFPIDVERRLFSIKGRDWWGRPKVVGRPEWKLSDSQDPSRVIALISDGSGTLAPALPPFALTLIAPALPKGPIRTRNQGRWSDQTPGWVSWLQPRFEM